MKVFSFALKAMRSKKYSVFDYWHCFPSADPAGVCLEVFSFDSETMPEKQYFIDGNWHCFPSAHPVV